LVLAVSLDGRLAPPGGGAAQIGGTADRRVLEEALAWADGCLIGAETLRRHGSTCLIHAPELREARRRAGRPEQPLALAVSRSGNLPLTLPFFRQPLERWLLAPPGTLASAAASTAPTPAAAIPAVPASTGANATAGLPPPFARHLPLEFWPAALASLAALDLQRLVLLGGAQLAAGLLAQGLVQELQLTVCPLLLGGPHTWLPLGDSLGGDAQGAGWILRECRPLADEELLLRYCRRDQGASFPG
jgi:5-amino-6-(5-phosphoribosylamino)uracil reductase